MRNCIRATGAALCLWPFALAAQTSPELAGVLQRLDRLERENRDLARQVQELKEQLAAGNHPANSVDPPPPQPAPASQPTAEERLDIQERRLDELAQSKVEASQKFPIRLTGMALFNSFLNSRGNNGAEYPTVAAPAPELGGATLRQTIIGLEFGDSKTFWGASVRGNLYMDFFTGTPPLAQTFRLRTGSIELDWKNTTLLVGQEKPIFNPRDPTSLAQVGVSPLTGTGNLWLWLPQVRLEERVSFTHDTGLRARVGVLETHEVPPYENVPVPGGVTPARPGWEGRFEFYHNLDENRRLEIAPGFHYSITHAGGISIPSSLFSLDWFFNPWRRLEFTGAFYSGQNVGNLGTGGINQSYVIYDHEGEAIRTKGGWGQLTLHTVPRIDLHLFAGQQDFSTTLLNPGDIGKNLLFGANLFFRIAPNVIVAPEISQLRTVYLVRGTVINNHYDLAVAYLF
ncbi:MAG TPA: hypothetical protein VKB88_07565 [Bryobacteraceae bacterium]|nr:hypothetical protein [Bryobacteraceae bacterium]